MAIRIQQKDFKSLCDKVTNLDSRLKPIIEKFGYPPFWHREPDFATLILTILEQQVSLAAAAAAYKKLKDRIIEISPENLLKLTDSELRDCYFSRQKIVYARHLASEIRNGNLNLKKLPFLHEE
ncbi:MAG: hypothetical protein JXR31_07680 [Prolixibacteraceae bacterium]|nr:hypothetical protein [Prolixibacteraceae bacterium]MBN2774112.1 hypothetical protein [Prolixibacteraceae bacterium]